MYRFIARLADFFLGSHLYPQPFNVACGVDGREVVFPHEVEEFCIEDQARVRVCFDLCCWYVWMTEDGGEAGLPFGVGEEWVCLEGGVDGDLRG